MPAPLMEFAQFAYPQQWWLRRGPPPWLEDSRWPVRAFRVSLVLGLMGSATGWFTMGGLLLAGVIDSEWGGSARWLTEGVLGLFCGPGFWFGLGVLIPFSRWLGRGWILSLLAVPVSMFACYCGVVTLLFVKPIMGQSPDGIPWAEEASGFYAGFVGAAIVSVWMGRPSRKTAWLAGGVASLLASIGCGLLFLTDRNPSPASSMLSQFTNVMSFGSPYFTFQSLTAVGLGIRLWWPERRVKIGAAENRSV